MFGLDLGKSCEDLEYHRQSPQLISKFNPASADRPIGRHYALHGTAFHFPKWNKGRIFVVAANLHRPPRRFYAIPVSMFLYSMIHGILSMSESSISLFNESCCRASWWSNDLWYSKSTRRYFAADWLFLKMEEQPMRSEQYFGLP